MRNIIFVLFFCNVISLFGQDKTEIYIQKYKDIAIIEMRKYDIPASITLAQAILESGNGESRLAIQGKNHFGIKCHQDWNGKTIIEDDDEKGECFRKYNKVSDSYRDHSLFLSERERYSFLFNYKINEYKLWAKGLKKAGYATNPKYAKLLINLIEKYNLQEYDLKEKKKLFFAHSYGLPYLMATGMYYFNNNYLVYSQLATSFFFSSFSFGYDYRLFSNLYFGSNSGLLYLPIQESDFSPQISSELIYRRYRSHKRHDSILFRVGVQYLFVNEIQFNLLSNHQLVPYFDLTYLLN